MTLGTAKFRAQSSQVPAWLGLDGLRRWWWEWGRGKALRAAAHHARVWRTPAAGAPGGGLEVECRELGWGQGWGSRRGRGKGWTVRAGGLGAPLGAWSLRGGVAGCAEGPAHETGRGAAVAVALQGPRRLGTRRLGLRGPGPGEGSHGLGARYPRADPGVRVRGAGRKPAPSEGRSQSDEGPGEGP